MTRALRRGTVCWRGRAARARLGGGMEGRRHQRKRRAWELNSAIPGRPSPTHELPHPPPAYSSLFHSPQRSTCPALSHYYSLAALLSASASGARRRRVRHRQRRRPPRARPARSHAPRPGRRGRRPHDCSHSPLAVVFPALSQVMFGSAWTRRARRPALFFSARPLPNPPVGLERRRPTHPASSEYPLPSSAA